MLHIRQGCMCVCVCACKCLAAFVLIQELVPGVMASPESKTKDGFEQQFGVNHLAHFLLFELLKPQLLASSTPEFQSRVVVLTSRGHQRETVRLDDLDFKKRGYEPFKSYGQACHCSA